MKTLVNFEIAKLLKEKGFNLLVNNHFADNGREEHFHPQYKANHNSSVSVGLKHSRPTIADVVMWIYEKHGIWIEVIETDLFSKFFFQIKRKDNSRLKNGDFNSPTEAYLEAITYTLNHLI